MAKTDLEIAQECVMEPIEKVAAKIGIPADSLEHYGKYKAKLSFDYLKSIENNPHGKLVLVTAINPTKAGEGKSTTTVGLGDALNRLGKKTMMALREPSLGPVFGLKGGATGGGYAQVVPMEDINLHFTGDMHAITTANNLVSACLDNVIHQGNELNIDPEKVTFKRCLDMNDRTLRNITIGCGAKANGVERKDGFNITVASEIMAALCLADDLMDLKKRFGKMLVAYTYDDKPVYVHDLGIEGALAMVMKDAVLPNIVQTLEHNPVLIHGGPFANIAHGCNSVIATKACLELADYTVTEAGFGADLGAEKFLDIKCRLANLKPNAVVIVATIRALKQHGGIALEDLKEENVEAMLAGCENLAKHIDTVQQFGLPYIVAINEFATDTPAEVAALEKWCEENNHPMSLSQVWAKGGEGAIDLANKVVALCDQENNYAPLYDLDKTIEEKIETIAKKVYGADGVDFTEEAQAQIAKFNELGWDKLPICMAKTQMSLSDDGKVMGRPTGFRMELRELGGVLGFLVGGLLPVQADLGIALAVRNARHAQVHTDLAALAVEVGHELIEDILLVLFADLVVVLHGLGIDAELMLGGELHLALDFLEHIALGVAHGALRGRLGTFIDITANLADPLFHIRILHLIFVGIFRLLAFVSLV